MLASILSAYFHETGWDEDALFSNLTRNQAAILDFIPPSSFHFSFSNRPQPGFHNSFEATALPNLNGSLSYVASSSKSLHLGSSESVSFRDVVSGFLPKPMPDSPREQDEIWLAGKRVDEKDWLVYGRMHLPSWESHGLWTRRLSPTTQAVISFITNSPASPPTPSSSSATSPTSSVSTLPTPPRTKSNAIISLQHSTGRYSTESTFSLSDGLIGCRGLWNFAPSSSSLPTLETLPPNVVRAEDDDGGSMIRRAMSKTSVDEEEITAGLRGRFSLGGEVYGSIKEKSAGLSLAGRFCTTPDLPTSFGFPPPCPTLHSVSSDTQLLQQPPPLLASPAMELLCQFSPLIGHLSSSLTSQIGSQLAVSSRYDVNVFSYESDWSIGACWWLRKGFRSDDGSGRAMEGQPQPVVGSREREAGVLKMRASTAGEVSLLYVSRISNVLFSIGVLSDFKSLTRPVKSLGAEVSFFS